MLRKSHNYVIINSNSHPQTSMKEYYTYAYLRKDGTPYYIGKGKKRKVGNAYSRTLAEHRNISIPPIDRIIILKHFDLEFDAFKHEIYMIAVFGRKDLCTGILHNRSAGGEGASEMSQEQREKVSKVHKGKVLSSETKKKISKTRLEREYKFSDERKQRYSEMYSGKGNPNYGKKHSPETLKKISKGTRNKNLKTRYYITPNGETITITNLREYCEEHNLNYNCMINLFNESAKSYKGYRRASASSNPVL
jgi:hypothetical protein